MELTETVVETAGGLRTARSFKLSDFEGPLDLLLYLIRKNERSVYDFQIGSITEQYFDYLRFDGVIDLEDACDFYALAATLLLIKSRALLPVDIDDDGDLLDPRQDLVERLIEYQKFKKLSELMEDKEKDAEWVLERHKLQHSLPFTDTDLWEKVDIWTLMKAFATIMRNIPRERIIDMYEEVTVNEKTTLLSELLGNRGECQFTDLITHPNSIMDVVCAFLAILEAVKMRMIIILQNRMFGDILIKPRAEKGQLGAGSV